MIYGGKDLWMILRLAGRSVAISIVAVIVDNHQDIIIRCQNSVIRGSQVLLCCINYVVSYASRLTYQLFCVTAHR